MKQLKKGCKRWLLWFKFSTAPRFLSTKFKNQQECLTSIKKPNQIVYCENCSYFLQ